MWYRYKDYPLVQNCGFNNSLLHWECLSIDQQILKKEILWVVLPSQSNWHWHTTVTALGKWTSQQHDNRSCWDVLDSFIPICYDIWLCCCVYDFRIPAPVLLQPRWIWLKTKNSGNCDPLQNMKWLRSRCPQGVPTLRWQRYIVLLGMSPVLWHGLERQAIKQESKPPNN